jgi:hypothetical protein
MRATALVQTRLPREAAEPSSSYPRRADRRCGARSRPDARTGVDTTTSSARGSRRASALPVCAVPPCLQQLGAREVQLREVCLGPRQLAGRPERREELEFASRQCRSHPPDGRRSRLQAGEPGQILALRVGGSLDRSATASTACSARGRSAASIFLLGEEATRGPEPREAARPGPPGAHWRSGGHGPYCAADSAVGSETTSRVEPRPAANSEHGRRGVGSLGEMGEDR